MGLDRRKPVFGGTGADQPAHPRRLISAFVIGLSRSIISRLATSEISIFKLVSVAGETGLKLALSETPKTGFLATRPLSHLVKYMLTSMQRLMIAFLFGQTHRPSIRSIPMRICIK